MICLILVSSTTMRETGLIYDEEGDVVDEDTIAKFCEGGMEEATTRTINQAFIREVILDGK